MATKKKDTNNKEVVMEENKEEIILTPAEYFTLLKDKINESTPEELKNLYNTTLEQLNSYIVTGQKTAAKELYAKAINLEKEYKLLSKGITKYVLKEDIDTYIDNVADECVVIIELKNYDRIIPNELVQVIADIKDLVDEFYIVFTDYTGEKRSKVEKERRSKDPILFANIFLDGRVSSRMYYLGDWIDEYCDLTLDKMIDELSKKNKDKDKKFVYDIEDNFNNMENIKSVLFGNNSVKSFKRG